MKFTKEQLKELFKEANEIFLKKDLILIKNKLCERCLCGSLMVRINEVLGKYSIYDGYYVDVEYNRNKFAYDKYKKVVINGSCNRVFCDLIVHSRGMMNVDNLIALEMKKSTNFSKHEDIGRIKALTTTSCFEKNTEYVSDYILGIYYEISYKEKKIKIQYFYNGELIEKEEVDF